MRCGRIGSIAIHSIRGSDVELQPADFVILGFTAVMTVLGLLRGLSGALAFLAGLSLGSAAVFIGWERALSSFSPIWLGIVAGIALFIVVFGLVRIGVRVVVGSLLKQPSDAVFGVILGLFCSAMLVWGLSDFPPLRDYSNLARTLHACIRP